MAKSGDTMRTALCAGGVGLLAGLLVIFIGIVNVVTRAKPEQPEPTYSQLQEAAFMGMTRGDWIFKKLEPNQILGRIAVVQSQTGDLDATIAKIDNEKLRIDAIRNQAVYDYLHNKVGPTEKPAPEDIAMAKKIALSINDQLLKADALRRVGEVQLRTDPAGAKATLAEAVAVVVAPTPPKFEEHKLFDPMTLLWPVGLAIFGILFALCLKPLLAGLMPAGRGKAVATAEEEDEDEEDEEKAKAVDVMPAEAMPAEAVPAADAMPVADVPMEPIADVPMIPDGGLAAPAPAPGSQLSRAAGEAPGAVAALDPKKTMIGRTGPAQPTMLAKQGPAQPTMLATKGPAVPTQLAQEGALPTKMAGPQDALPMPNLPPTGKTQKK